MAIIKGKTDGGNGGKRGHSNMNHWMYSDEIKEAARKARRIDAKAVVAAEMAEHIKDHDHFHCKKCGATWSIPFVPSSSVRAAILELIRSGKRLHALAMLDSEWHDLKASKATIYHMPFADAKCHQCSSTLLDQKNTHKCPKCGAINFIWNTP
jgi:rubrerythrin